MSTLDSGPQLPKQMELGLHTAFALSAKAKEPEGEARHFQISTLSIAQAFLELRPGTQI